MDPKRLVRVSKYLSKHLRHQPERLGLQLAPGGWVEVDRLLKACARNQFPLTPSELQEVVEKNDKQRFSFDESGLRIRANQGHSTVVDLELQATTPPAILYHGTGSQNVDSILGTGLLRMARHHVHLSETRETAHKVGARHGKPVIFEVDAARMHQEGIVFYCSANNVWLVDHVSPEYPRLT